MTNLPDLSVKRADCIVDAIYEAYEAKARKGQNERIGAADLGNECNRAIWYNFRWCSDKSFQGRMLRLFDSGHAQEQRLIEDLRSIGCTVMDVNPDTGKQWKELLGRVVVKPDGKVLGVLGAEKTWHVLETKTFNAKNFAKLLKDGVRAAKPEHYIQCQIEMFGFKMERALYLAVCKDTDELYAERLDLDKEYAEGLLNRVEKIADSNTPPEKLSSDPAFWKCKFCDHHAVCHMDKVAQVNCRTCCHSESKADGTWWCIKHDVELDYKAQQEGCGKHLFNPALVPNSTPVDANPDEGWIEYESDGVLWRQGENYVTSKEMVGD